MQKGFPIEVLRMTINGKDVTDAFVELPVYVTPRASGNSHQRRKARRAAIREMDAIGIHFSAVYSDRFSIEQREISKILRERAIFGGTLID